MNRKRKIYETFNEDEINIEKTTKRPPNNYDKRMKVKDISNDRSVDSKIVNEFKRKSQIKKKSSHIRFSNSKSKMNSSLKSKSLKEIDVYDQISFEEFHTDSGSSNSEESKKMTQVFSSMFIQRFTNKQMETDYLEPCQEDSQASHDTMIH